MEGRPPTRPHRALLEKEYEFDGGYAERRREAERLRPLIREGLIDELVENPNMSADEIRESIEDQIDEED
jgi:bisphosphoglycerate-independent phosphoglycerate mutase (AlkP superfamily)